MASLRDTGFGSGHFAESTASYVFPGKTEMAQRMRNFNWGITPLGAFETWPQSLRTSMHIMLTSRHAMFIWWGKEFINLYNDAYAGFLHKKHPWALGQPAHTVWSEVWEQLSPKAERAIGKDEGTLDESVLYILSRKNYPEEVYVTSSYSPIPSDGRIGGILASVIEDTEKVIEERQLNTIGRLSTETLDARTAKEACQLSGSALESNPHDFTFAAIYLQEP